MGKFVECVPNFSEGRDLDKINAIVDAARAVPGVLILDVEKDADHNRTVLTFMAPVETAADAMFAVTKKAAQLIDLNVHKGEHPRMGATDVAPFIPIMDSTIEDCIKLAETAGERIGRELQIPVYLYDRAAKFDHRKDLAKVRKGQFEGLREVIGKDPERVPDFGPNHIHPTAGAMAVGARNQIVNFNVNLNTTDMEFAKGLAKKIRTTGGGLPALRAKEIFLESKGQVQMSTVLTDYKTTSIKRVLDEMQKDLGPKGIEITGTELIGLTTQEALTDYAVENLKVQGFNKADQVLETKQYSEIIMTRVTVPVGEDIGFLPGTEEEKMAPWMGALEDNLDVLNKTDDEAGDWGRAATRDLIRSRIKVKSLNFMRGRTFINKYLIIDEAQNLTPKQMKTLITRAGPGTKVVCLGNIAQIDTPYLTEGSSGLTYVVDRFKGWTHSGHITLQRGERSRLADHAAEVL